VGTRTRTLFGGALAASGIVILLFAVALTGSRGAAIAAVPALAYLGVSTVGRLRRPAVMGLVVTSVVLFGLVLPRIPVDLSVRILSSPSELRGGTIGLRRSLWEAGASLWANHPLLGVGAGAAPTAAQTEGLTSRADVIHNTPISIGAELGTVGFLLFAALLFALTVRIWPPVRRVRILALALLATWFLGSLTLTWEYEKATWLVLGIILVSGGIRSSPTPDGRSA
jgi:O-antigen ligase